VPKKSQAGHESDVMTSDKTERFARDVVRGLSGTPKTLDCKYLYDERGSELFEDICRQPEYYLTRTESEILERHAHRIAERVGPVDILELGSGGSQKTQHLLQAFTERHDEVRYVPVDISPSALVSSKEDIESSLPDVTVTPVEGSYDDALRIASDLGSGTTGTMVVFLGSTLGNFSGPEFDTFWSSWARQLDPGDNFLLGVDLHKDKDTLEAAYNDAAGVTAQFTRNLFTRMNRELGSSVDLDAVEHVARYARERRQIEIFARVTRPQEIEVPSLGERVPVDAGEMIQIEISRKFELPGLRSQLDARGFSTAETYTDEQELFADLLLERSLRAA
jgi:L-histidine N-alpha-methyltransferase